MKIQREKDEKNFRVYAWTAPILSYLRQKGLKVGILSNQCSFYENIYQNSGIPDFVDTEVFSNREGVRKPNPKMYIKAVQRLDVDFSEALMVGNHFEQDYTIPISLGMNALHLVHNSEFKHGFQIKSLKDLVSYL